MMFLKHSGTEFTEEGGKLELCVLGASVFKFHGAHLLACNNFSMVLGIGVSNLAENVSNPFLPRDTGSSESLSGGTTK